MSVQDALAFIQRLGSRPDLQEKLRSISDRVELADIVQMGNLEGLDFTHEEFRTAFVRDWKMRRLYYGKRES